MVRLIINFELENEHYADKDLLLKHIISVCKILNAEDNNVKRVSYKSNCFSAEFRLCEREMNVEIKGFYDNKTNFDAVFENIKRFIYVLNENFYVKYSKGIVLVLYENDYDIKNSEHIVKLIKAFGSLNKAIEIIKEEGIPTSHNWDMGFLANEKVEKLSNEELKEYVKFLANKIIKLSDYSLDIKKAFDINFFVSFYHFVSLGIDDYELFQKYSKKVVNDLREAVDNFMYAYCLLNERCGKCWQNA